jgi:putative spermidine/putrescine transport system permease protein
VTAARLRLLAGALLAFWLLLPLVPLAIWSFARGWRFPALLPQDWTMNAWQVALTPGRGVLEGLGLTAGIALAAAALAALVGVPAGRALGQHEFRGKGLVLLLLVAPIIVPAIAVVPGMHEIFLRLGLAGTTSGVILAHLVPVIPYMTLIMASVFSGFDTVHEDQARSLGAGPLAVWRHVTLPAILPGLLTGFLFAFLVSWSQYLLTLSIGGGRVQTLPLTLFAYASAGRNDLAGALAVLYVLPGILILLITARQVSGRHPAVTGGAFR